MWLHGMILDGATRLTPEHHRALACRVHDNRHAQDVIDRMHDYLGDVAAQMGPVDLSRNVLRSWLDRVCRAYSRPPLCTGINERLAQVIGDYSATTLIKRYAAAGGRPYPTAAAQASALAQRYEQAAGYAGVLLDFSPRSGGLSLRTIKPSHLKLVYGDDDPHEPTVIVHYGTRQIGGRSVPVAEVYDLTDPKQPAYRIYRDNDEAKDVTSDVHGRTFVGDDYIWRDGDRAFHRILVRGHPDRTFDRLQQVETTLAAATRWTAWGSGTDFASHPGRNVKGLALVGVSSDTSTGATGMADGPNVIKKWVDEDPDNPGEHWQDAPAFDPLTNAKAVLLYESSALSMQDLPIQFDSTGGEPTAREQEALEERIEGTLAECRRFDAELLRRCSALARALPEVSGDDFPAGPFGLLYRGEIDEALSSDDTSNTSTGDDDG